MDFQLLEIVEACGVNPPGLLSVYAVRTQAVDVVPRARQSIIIGDIVLVAAQLWAPIGFASDGAGFQESPSATANGELFRQKVTVEVPDDRPEVVDWLNSVRQGTFMLAIEDGDGRYRIVGHPDAPARMLGDVIKDAKPGGRDGFTFVFEATSASRAPFYDGVIASISGGTSYGADAVVIDTDLSVHSVPRGDTYYCTIPAPANSVKTINFGTSATLAFELFRLGFSGTIDLSAVTLVNVASVTYELNGVAVTGVQAIALGDLLKVSITRSAAGVSSVELSFDYGSETIVCAVPAWRWARWTNLANMSIATDTWNATTRGLRCTDNGSDAFDKGANSIESFSGVWRIEASYLCNGTIVGINNSASDAANLARINYGWYMANINAAYIYEGGALKDVLFGTGNRILQSEFAIVDDGSSIKYWYRYPGGSWILKYTSLLTYTPGATWYADVIMSYDGSRLEGVKLFT